MASLSLSRGPNLQSQKFQGLFGYCAAANQCLSCNVTEAHQTSVPAGVKQSQNNATADTAGGSYNPRIGRAGDTKLAGKLKIWNYKKTRK